MKANMEKKKHKVGEEERPKNRINLMIFPGRRLFGNPQRHVESFATKGQVVADLGCYTGFYTFALAECVGPEGKVYAVDLDEGSMQVLLKQIDKGGYSNIEAHAQSASDIKFIKDKSVDFVLANGLLCSMADNRSSVVHEIKRILKPGGLAYLSLGAPPPLGFVGSEEWENILAGFRVKQRGGFLQKWAVVSTK